MRIYNKKEEGKEGGKERYSFPLGSKNETDLFEFICLEVSHPEMENSAVPLHFSTVRGWRP